MTIQHARVFISHSHADNWFVERLANDCESAGVRSWLDLWEIGVGDSLRRRIEDGIAESAWLAVVLSRASVESEWVQNELSMGFVRELDERRVVVLPLLIEECQVPLSLKDKLFADFRNDYQRGFELLLHRLKGTDPRVAHQRRKLERYWLKCDQQLPYFCTFLSLNVGAGQNVTDALREAVLDLPAPLKDEITEVIRQYDSGFTLVDSFNALASRVPTFRCRFLCRALRTSIESGGRVSDAFAQWNYLKDIDEGEFLR